MNLSIPTVRTLTARLVCIIALLAVFAATPASAAKLKVGDGEVFATIMEAMDAANPGDTILVKGGVYDPFVINKSVRLKTRGPGDPLIDCQGEGTGIIVEADGAWLNGFTVTDCEVGIGLHGANNTLIEQNTILNNWGEHSLWIILNSADNQILSNQILDADFNGFVINADAGTNNTLSFNEVEGVGNDAFTIDTHGNSLFRNIAQFNFGQGFDTTGNDNVLFGNTALGNASDGFIDFGIGNYYKNNSSHENGDYGFDNYEGMDNIFKNNRCDDNVSGGSNPEGLCKAK